MPHHRVVAHALLLDLERQTSSLRSIVTQYEKSFRFTTHMPNVLYSCSSMSLIAQTALC